MNLGCGDETAQASIMMCPSRCDLSHLDASDRVVSPHCPNMARSEDRTRGGIARRVARRCVARRARDACSAVGRARRRAGRELLLRARARRGRR
jgi:hypothetical protein